MLFLNRLKRYFFISFLSMNSPAITIEDVNLQIDKSNEYIEGKAQIIITLKNNSKTLTYYILQRPRNIDYDRGSHTLSIDRYEKQQPQDIKVNSSPFEPEQVAILPDTILQWEYLLPVWLKKITRPSGSREIVEVLDISTVQKVVCTVAYHIGPFRANPSETVSASFERTLISQ